MLRGALQVSFSDAQCGFKAMRSDVARRLLPLVQDTNWFFDTELLVLAQRAGQRVPVDWVDDPGTTVDIAATATEDLRGVWRLMKNLTRGDIPIAVVRANWPARPAGRGGSAGAARADAAVRGRGRGVHAGVLRTVRAAALGPGRPGRQPDRPGAHRGGQHRGEPRCSPSACAADGLFGHHVVGLVAFVVALGLTSGSLALLHLLAADASRLVEVLVLRGSQRGGDGGAVSGAQVSDGSLTRP